ncbi:MAG: entericidin A/B family lipoprotein [Phycisphaerales bacterium]|nr:entericidin A/B family lipoprotein [Phycisphaerales bacterium]
MLRRHIRLVAVSFMTMLYVVILVGCNTMEGAGQDVEAAGEAVQDAAD